MVFYIIIWDHLKFENSLVNNELEYGMKIISVDEILSICVVIFPLNLLNFFYY